MRSLRVLTALLFLAPFAAQAQYSIASVTFKNPGPYTTPELLAVSGLEAGQLLNQNSLGNAVQHLLDTGLFSDATINYTGTGMRRGIVVGLKPIPLDKLLPASFENFVWFTPEELTAGIHAHVPLYRGVASDAGTLPDDIQSALQQMLVAKGITATLSHAIVEPTNLHPIRVISFRIDQPTIRLNTVHLSMEAPTGASPALTPGLQKAATLATRAPFNEGLADLTLQDILLSSVRNAGYIQATLDNLQRTAAPSPTDPKTLLVTYTARIVTGDPYKVSNLTYNPTPLYSAADFSRDAKLHPGDIANESDLAKTQSAISDVYLSHGYLDIYVLSHPAFDAAAHTVAYTLEPIPGDIYHLHTVTPTGLSPEALQEFNSAWTMKPGDIYNPAYVATFVKQNKTLPPPLQVPRHLPGLRRPSNPPGRPDPDLPPQQRQLRLAQALTLLTTHYIQI
jgi:outer membrane protein assembly factor BamA